MMYPYGKMTFDEAYEVFSEQAKIVSQYNYDGAFLETFTDLQELRAAVIAFKENTDLPIFASMSFEKGGRTYTGVSIESFVLTMQSLGVTAVGINCGTGADIACDNVKRMIKVASLPIFVKPNAGMPKLIDGVTRYDATAKEFAHFMKEIALLGVGILGGCCGTDSQYIEENYSKKLTLNMLAEVACMHPNYLCNCFRKRMNMTVFEYIDRVRLHHALEYLRQGKMTISEIAERTGYSSLQAFSKNFRKVYTVSPRNYGSMENNVKQDIAAGVLNTLYSNL